MDRNDIEINFSDPKDEGLLNFANLVDPINLSIFIEKVKDSTEKKSIDELVLDLLEGR